MQPTPVRSPDEQGMALTRLPLLAYMYPKWYKVARSDGTFELCPVRVFNEILPEPYRSSYRPIELVGADVWCSTCASAEHSEAECSLHAAAMREALLLRRETAAENDPSLLKKQRLMASAKRPEATDEEIAKVGARHSRSSTPISALVPRVCHFCTVTFMPIMMPLPCWWTPPLCAYLHWSLRPWKRPIEAMAGGTRLPKLACAVASPRTERCANRRLREGHASAGLVSTYSLAWNPLLPTNPAPSAAPALAVVRVRAREVGCGPRLSLLATACLAPSINLLNTPLPRQPQDAEARAWAKEARVEERAKEPRGVVVCLAPPTSSPHSTRDLFCECYWPN